MNHYTAYGLRIRSEIEIPELCRADAGWVDDVHIGIATIDGPLPGADVPRLANFRAENAYLAWRHIGRFLIEPNGRVTVESLTNNQQLVRFALLGPVLAAVLQYRGIPLLHGSAVAQAGKAILLVGHKRAGKSTTAAALAALGCSILNDDVLPLFGDHGSIELVAGFPGLKLSSDAKDRLLPKWPVAGSEPPGSSNKVIVTDAARMSGNFPIASIIVLDPQAPLEPVLLEPLAALQELLQHGYALKFGTSALGDGQSEALFQACARLAHGSRVIRIGRPDDIGGIRAFARGLLDYTTIRA